MKIVFRFGSNSEERIEGYQQLNLLAHAQMLERSLQSRCGGQRECSTCRVIVVSGKVSPMREPERELLERVGAFRQGQQSVRLACQTFPEEDVGGEVILEVPTKKFQDARR